MQPHIDPEVYWIPLNEMSSMPQIRSGVLGPNSIQSADEGPFRQVVGCEMSEMIYAMQFQ